MKSAITRLGAISLSCCFLSAVAVAQTFETIDPPDSVSTQTSEVHKGRVVGTYNRTLSYSFSRLTGYQTFAVPGADSRGTYAKDSDDHGRVTGWFGSTDSRVRAFVRSPSGAITVFDATKRDSQNTYPFDMNGPGFIVGQYFTVQDSLTTRGFFRAPNGVTQPIRIPGNEVVIPWAINDAGTIAGFLATAFDTEHKGFIRAPIGKLTIFAGTPECGLFDSTLVMNNKGDVAGICESYNSGFLRRQSGEFQSINYPGAVGTQVSGIDADGDVAGLYVDATDFGSHGFIRSADGTYVSFDFPGAAPGSTSVSGMDANGDIVGMYYDSDQRQHGFIRYADGN